MKKTLLCLLLFSVCICFGACRMREKYKFLQPTEEIVEISIVAISLSWEDSEIIEMEIAKIDDIDRFLEDFSEIKCYASFSPDGAAENHEDDIVVKVLYRDNSYEFINHCGQSNYTEGKGLKYYEGMSAFDKEQFEALITKYSSPAA